MCDILCSWAGGSNRKNINSSQFVYSFNAVPTKIPAIFSDIDKLILKFIWNRFQDSQTILTKKNEKGGIALPDGKACNLATVTKRIQDLWGETHTVGWVRMENPETGPYTYAQVVLTKMQRQFHGGRIIFSMNAARTNGQVLKKIIGPKFTPYTKITSSSHQT